MIWNMMKMMIFIVDISTSFRITIITMNITSAAPETSIYSYGSIKTLSAIASENVINKTGE